MVSYFLNNADKTCLNGLKISENIDIGHFFQPRTFFHLSSNLHTSCSSAFNINNKVYINPSLCPYYRYIWGQCKDLQRRKMTHHVFCLGSAVAIKLTDQSLPLKIYHDSDIPYSQLDSIAE